VSLIAKDSRRTGDVYKREMALYEEENLLLMDESRKNISSVSVI
jgi:hypothetical protein